MKGRIFFKAAVSCLAKIAGCIPLIACSDDNNEPEIANILTLHQDKLFTFAPRGLAPFFDIWSTYP